MASQDHGPFTIDKNHANHDQDSNGYKAKQSPKAADDDGSNVSSIAVGSCDFEKNKLVSFVLLKLIRIDQLHLFHQTVVLLPEEFKEKTNQDWITRF